MGKRLVEELMFGSDLRRDADGGLEWGETLRGGSGPAPFAGELGHFAFDEAGVVRRPANQDGDPWTIARRRRCRLSPRLRRHHLHRHRHPHRPSRPHHPNLLLARRSRQRCLVHRRAASPATSRQAPRGRVVPMAPSSFRRTGRPARAAAVWLPRSPPFAYCRRSARRIDCWRDCLYRSGSRHAAHPKKVMGSAPPHNVGRTEPQVGPDVRSPGMIANRSTAPLDCSSYRPLSCRRNNRSPDERRTSR